MTFVRKVNWDTQTNRKHVSWKIFGIVFTSLVLTINCDKDVETYDASQNGTSYFKYKPINNFLKFGSVNELNHYKTYDQITEFILTYPDKGPMFYQVQRLGTTYEDRDVLLVKMSIDLDLRKPAILVDAGVHGREWASVSSALFLIQTLKEHSFLLNYADWYIIPLVNPDGYVYSMTPGNENWRKNRSKGRHPQCIGVDLNRNYDFHWGEPFESQKNCSSTIYHGEAPFSELETEAIRNYMKKAKTKIKAYLSLHTNGQHISYPYGYQASAVPGNWKDHEKIGKMMAAAIYKDTGNNYTVSSSGGQYRSGGISEDYVRGVLDIPLALSIKLTKEASGFEYPESKLPVAYHETLQAAFMLARETARIFPGQYD